jgi:hypothetical protein
MRDNIMLKALLQTMGPVEAFAELKRIKADNESLASAPIIQQQ